MVGGLLKPLGNEVMERMITAGSGILMPPCGGLAFAGGDGPRANASKTGKTQLAASRERCFIRTLAVRFLPRWRSTQRQRQCATQ